MGQNNQCLTYFGHSWGFEKWPEKLVNGTLCEMLKRQNYHEESVGNLKLVTYLVTTEEIYLNSFPHPNFM